MVKARLITRSKDGNRAQVVVLIGEGANQRSITRHIRNEGGRWVGRNPDESALARLDMAERRLTEFTKFCHIEIDPLARLKDPDLNRFIDEIRRHKEDARGVVDVPEMVLKHGLDLLKEKGELKIGDLKAKINGSIAVAGKTLKEVSRNAEELRKEIPGVVEFSLD